MVLKRTLPSRVQLAQPAPASAPSAPVTAPAPQPEIPAVAEPVAVAPAPVAAAKAEPTPAPVAEAVAPAEAAGEVEVSVSRPDGGGMRRKVREKKPRTFDTASGDEPVVVTAAPAPSVVPQTDVDFEKVGEKLSSLGVTEAKRDVLTEKAAPATPVSEAPFEDIAPEAPAAKETPAWLVELQKELAAANEPKDKDPRRAALNLPPPPTLPPNLLAGLVEDESSADSFGPAPEPTPSPAAAASFGAPAAASESLPPSGMSLATKTPASPSQSDLPWTNPAPKDDWQLDIGAGTPGSGTEGASLPPSAVQPGDIYGGLGQPQAAAGGAGSPPWQGAGNVPPAELPGPRNTFRNMGAPASGGFQLVAAVAVLALVGGGAWYMLSKPDNANERLARWSGSLRETTETLPDGQNGPVPERTVRMDELAQNDGLLPPPDPNASSIQALPSSGGSSSAVIDFADVAPNQQRGPITADGSEQMPEDIGFIASLQKAIAEKKAERSGDASPGVPSVPAAGAPVTPAATGTETAMDKTIKNEALKAQLDAELAAYRKALVDAGNVAEAPRPAEFLANAQAQAAQPTPSPYIGANAQSGATAPLQPPPAAQAAGLPPAELYGSNPGNLPVLPEPVAEQPKVRQLSDFDVSMFEPDKDKVRIPKGIRPRMSTGDFPEMDVLSLVPNKGLIAYHNGQEGVLLIGETVDGWQLVGVNGQAAEFRGSGGKTYYVSAEQ